MADEPTDGMVAYVSHKRVLAGQIREVVVGGCYVLNGDGSAVFRRYAPHMDTRYRPLPGDWWMVYPDGYEAVSPRQAFEDGYAPVEAPGPAAQAELDARQAKREQWTALARELAGMARQHPGHFWSIPAREAAVALMRLLGDVVPDDWGLLEGFKPPLQATLGLAAWHAADAARALKAAGDELAAAGDPHRGVAERVCAEARDLQLNVLAAREDWGGGPAGAPPIAAL